MIAAMLLTLMALSLSSCRSQVPIVVSGHHFRDSTKTVVKTDTFLLHDSIFITQFTVKGDSIDTVFVKEYRTQWKYRVRQLHDTVAIIVRDSVPIYPTAPVVQQGKKNDSGTSVFGIAFAACLVIPIAVLSIKYLIGK